MGLRLLDLYLILVIIQGRISDKPDDFIKLSIIVKSDDKNMKIRILLTKSRLDGHDRGVRYVVKKLSEAGMEVIFTRYETPEDIVQAALEEDIDVIGISFSTGSPMMVTSEVMKLAREKQLDDVPVIVGGIIPSDEIPKLQQIGVARCFGPGSSAREIIDFIESCLMS